MLNVLQDRLAVYADGVSVVVVAVVIVAVKRT